MIQNIYSKRSDIFEQSRPPIPLTLWLSLLAALSIVWPRYGFLSLGPIQATPFTAMSIASWGAIPALVLLMPKSWPMLSSACRDHAAILAAFTLYAAWRLICSIIGETPVESSLMLAREIIYIWPLFLCALFLSRSDAGRTLLLRVIVLSTGFVVLAAAFELASGRTIINALGLNFSIDAVSLRNTSEEQFRGGSYRLKSIFFHSILMGQFLCWAVPLCAYAAFRDPRRAFRISATVVAVAGVMAAVLSGSRSAFIGLIICATAPLALISVRNARNSLHSTLFLVALTVAISFTAVLFAAPYVASLVGGRDGEEAASSTWRAAMLARAFTEVSYSPLFGFGDGRAAYHAGFLGRMGTLTIDSAYVSALLDSGWVGLGLQLYAWGLVAVAALREAIFGTDRVIGCVLVGSVLALLSVFGIVSITDNISLLILSVGLLPRKQPKGVY